MPRGRKKAVAKDQRTIDEQIAQLEEEIGRHTEELKKEKKELKELLKIKEMEEKNANEEKLKQDAMKIVELAKETGTPVEEILQLMQQSKAK